jgi:2-methylisocitrate lyase-like PEP mutase family enzyme
MEQDTMNQVERARTFSTLHVKGAPLTLYNAWDAGSAKAIQDAGAPAIATSSWAVAAAHGYEDGEAIPIALVDQIIARMAAMLEVPLTVDFEGGYSENVDILAANVSKLLDAGVIGINFEDRVVSGEGLHGVEQQSRRIAAIRKAASERGIPLFINARTDLFLASGAEPSSLMNAAKERAAAYADAGASGFFVPGLRSEALIADICAASALPVNVMMFDGVPGVSKLSELGVARISFGPIPFIKAMEALKVAAKTLYAG